MRLVLDTNVWLDWLVFQDPRMHRLIHAVDQGLVHILATEAMLREFDGVVARPFFRLDGQAVHELAQRIRGLVQPMTAAPDCRLPCTDPADQMFIDLAVAHRADWLLSRDKALLRLARLAARRFALRIGTPETWLSAQDSGAPVDPVRSEHLL
jgi:putative PIN family toxin of toxin-antitoxin system